MDDILLDSAFSQTMVIVAVLTLLVGTVGQTMLPIGVAGGTLYRTDIFLKGLYTSVPSFIVLGYFLYNGFEEDSKLSNLQEFIYLISTGLITLYALFSFFFIREEVGFQPGVIRIHKGRITVPFLLLAIFLFVLAGLHVSQTGLKETFSGSLEGFSKRGKLESHPVPETQQEFGPESSFNLNYNPSVKESDNLTPNQKSNQDLELKEIKEMKTNPLYVYDPRLVDFYQSDGNSTNESYIADDFNEDFLNLRVNEDRQRKLIFGN